MANVEDIHYNLPENRKRKISVLAEIVEIPRTRFRDVSQEDAIRALTGLILYRHLGRLKKREVNRHWATLPRELQMSLRQKRANILVNPAWGMWSLSNEQLLARNELNQKVDTWAKILGLGEISVATLGSVLGQLKNGNVAGVIALLVTGAFFTINSLEGQEINAEMVRRLKGEGAL